MSGLLLVLKTDCFVTFNTEKNNKKQKSKAEGEKVTFKNRQRHTEKATYCMVPTI